MRATEFIIADEMYPPISIFYGLEILMMVQISSLLPVSKDSYVRPIDTLISTRSLTIMARKYSTWFLNPNSSSFRQI